MNSASENQRKKKICAALLAHVDAGKTTLSEAILYKSGQLKNLGRVDNGNTFLDTNVMERERSITIFSKQAVFSYGNLQMTLVDTPGHVDFSAEMERTLQILDYAILLVSASDGIQGHTRTLWELFSHYEIPVFLFINKMDQPDTEKEKILKELQETFGDGCISFEEKEEIFYDAVAMSGEDAIEEFLETGTVSVETIQELILKRKVFPCYFGSARTTDGVEEFLKGLEIYTKEKKYPEDFSARVFKIGRDEGGNRLTYLKITGGTLSVRQMLSGKNQDGEEWEEKVTQIRIYSGERFEPVSKIRAGEVCAVTGLNATYAGQGLGAEESSNLPVLEPVLTYQIRLPEGVSANAFLPKLRLLEEEIPEIKIVWNEALEEIQARLMGEVQIEILRRLIWERFHEDVHFDAGKIVYKETISNVVEGVGHFEPLRHYAEVHLRMEPGENGSGVQVRTECSEDLLSRNWQRLICTHVLEREHAGVLIGAPLTDVIITVVSGKAHTKHTEGGDFRQATYRAVRQGLMKAQNVLLEPYYDFRLELPTEMIGRAMTEIETLSGKLKAPENLGEVSILSGYAPVSTMQNYGKEVYSYTKGQGKLFCTLKGYYPCHNAEEVWEASHYDPEADPLHPAGSVFCSHGAGFVVPWYEVEKYMHMPLAEHDVPEMEETEIPSFTRERPAPKEEYFMGEEEVLSILSSTAYANRKNDYKHPYKKQKRTVASAGKPAKKAQKQKSGERYLLVDGYNIVFAWEELHELAKTNIDAARSRLMDILCNYQGYQKCTLILVFDAYKVRGNIGEMFDYHNIHVVYTREAETADQYIEKLAHQMGRDYDVTVATSDGLEQLIIRGQGCKLLSARDFYEEVKRVEEQIREFL